MATKEDLLKLASDIDVLVKELKSGDTSPEVVQPISKMASEGMSLGKLSKIPNKELDPLLAFCLS